MDNPIQIESYRHEFASEYARINREWLDAHGLYEDEDGAHLYSPDDTILSAGGKIYVAMQEDNVVGTCALIKISSTEYELVKLTVAQRVRGQGLGRRLTEHAIQEAHELGASIVTLLSSSKLSAAIQLYDSLGFVSKPLPKDQPFETADIYMELDLSMAKLSKLVT